MKSERRTDGTAVVFGVIFLIIAGWWFADRVNPISVPGAGWIVALGLIGVGVAGVVSALRNPRR